MRVFISWSGDVSKPLAQALRDWLPTVLQAIRPYFSPDDVAKGARWSSEIAQELQGSSFGVLCVTADNFTAPWLVFEAGALSKSIDTAKVCPLLFGIEPTDVTGPLAQFQATKFEKAEVEHLLRSMNRELGDAALAGDVFTAVFEMWWPRLETRVAAAMMQAPTEMPERPARDVLNEVLGLTRSISAVLEKRPDQPEKAARPFVSTAALNDLLIAWRELVEAAKDSDDQDTRIWMRAMRIPLHHVVSRVANESALSTFRAISPEFWKRDSGDEEAVEVLLSNLATEGSRLEGMLTTLEGETRETAQQRLRSLWRTSNVLRRLVPAPRKQTDEGSTDIVSAEIVSDE